MTHDLNDDFERDGVLAIPGVLQAAELAAIPATGLPATRRGGSRCLMDQDWCRDLAARLATHPQLRPLLPTDPAAVQCTYFEKSAGRNWLVTLHQDRSIPVAARVDGAGLTGWSEKEGSVFVHAPLGVLAQLVAVRLHLDDCLAIDGPLRVVPGSHRAGVLEDPQAFALRDQHGERLCEARAGDVLLMRPLALHASSKATGNGRRRVLHFVFGPRPLPFGLAWPAQVTGSAATAGSAARIGV